MILNIVTINRDVHGLKKINAVLIYNKYDFNHYTHEIRESLKLKNPVVCCTPIFREMILVGITCLGGAYITIPCHSSGWDRLSRIPQGCVEWALISIYTKTCQLITHRFCFETSIMYQSVSRWKIIITQCILKYHISAHCCRNVDVSFHGHSSWIRIPINNIIQWPNSVRIYISQEYNFGFQSNVMFSVAIYPCNALARNTIIISPLLIFTSDDLKGVSKSDQPLSWNYNTQGFSNGGVHNMNYQMMLTLTT